MSQDEQKISNLIDGGELLQKRQHIQKFVEKWMNGFEKDTFISNEHGVFIYYAGSSGINIKCFFEELLEDYIDEHELTNNK